MKQIKIGKKYVTRCGRYVFKVQAPLAQGQFSTVCVKILDDKDRSGTTWCVGWEASHYIAGNWMAGKSGRSSDLVKRYRKGKPVEKVEQPVPQQFSDGHARLGVKITAADVGRKVLLRNGEQSKIVIVRDSCVFYEHGSSTRSASVYGSWTLDAGANYGNINSYDIVGFVKGGN